MSSPVSIGCCGGADPPSAIDVVRLDSRILNHRLMDGGFLLVVPKENPREVVRNLVRAPLGVRFVVAVSPDVRLDDDEQVQWGIFTRFDPARDMFFTEQSFVGARPVYRGMVGIDATWKEGYPAPLEMDAEIVKKVDGRWGEYWR